MLWLITIICLFSKGNPAKILLNKILASLPTPVHFYYLKLIVPFSQLLLYCIGFIWLALVILFLITDYYLPFAIFDSDYLLSRIVKTGTIAIEISMFLLPYYIYNFESLLQLFQNHIFEPFFLVTAIITELTLQIAALLNITFDF